MGVGVTVAKGEVGWVVRHRMALGGDAYAHSCEGEILGNFLSDSDALDRVTLVLVRGRLEGILKFHICVERVILRRGTLARDAIIKRCSNLCFLREELTKVEVGGDAVGGVFIGGTLHDLLLQSAEAVADVFA